MVLTVLTVLTVVMRQGSTRTNLWLTFPSPSISNGYLGNLAMMLGPQTSQVREANAAASETATNLVFSAPAASTFSPSAPATSAPDSLLLLLLLIPLLLLPFFSNLPGEGGAGDDRLPAGGRPGPGHRHRLLPVLPHCQLPLSTANTYQQSLETALTIFVDICLRFVQTTTHLCGDEIVMTWLQQWIYCETTPVKWKNSDWCRLYFSACYDQVGF